ncbi:hypothetical protein EIN_182250 [Entamoeba invadens IP1]|uniref:hypothetical protein n=1 Tax=Entamoeba invadens IP1 TaxID=370355 RepID=UPI0002C3D79E|nr:hypothetical protein EIN_182250 [Entamoeba invadens IP1]ELP94008.1 hypothetical protein EIN_182250 [Entamoeba invadens IP1]|eukprot:XP_004260779.1 hypothetical protein EIN_182250 [Entamoeba invadens IP1]
MEGCTDNLKEVIYKKGVVSSECQKLRLAMTFNTTSQQWQNKKGVQVTSASEKSQFESLISKLEGMGYTLGSNLFIVSYDWRHESPKLMSYGARVIYAAFGFGGILLEKSMREKGDFWIKNNVEKVITLNSQWSGDVTSLLQILDSGDANPNLLLRAELLSFVTNFPVVVDNEEIIESNLILSYLTKIGYDTSSFNEFKKAKRGFSQIPHLCAFFADVITPNTLRAKGKVVSVYNYTLGDTVTSLDSLNDCIVWTQNSTFLGKSKRELIYTSKKVLDLFDDKLCCLASQPSNDSSSFSSWARSCFSYISSFLCALMLRLLF